MSSYEAVCRAVATLEASSVLAQAAQQGNKRDEQELKSLARQRERELTAVLLAPIQLMTKYQVGVMIMAICWLIPGPLKHQGNNGN
jgi:hypothetical protein